MGQKELRNYGRFEKGHQYAPYNESVVNQISIKKVYLVEDKMVGIAPDDFEDVKNVWKDVQIKSQKELISLINKK